MAVGRSGFIGMYDWDIHSDVILNNVSIDTEHLEINGFINASRGQDVFIDKDELTYSTKKWCRDKNAQRRIYYTARPGFQRLAVGI